MVQISTERKYSTSVLSPKNIYIAHWSIYVFQMRIHSDALRHHIIDSLQILFLSLSHHFSWIFMHAISIYFFLLLSHGSGVCKTYSNI